jgi:hypothetical protein
MTRSSALERVWSNNVLQKRQNEVSVTDVTGIVSSPASQRQRITARLRAEVIKHYDQGMSSRRVAAALGLGRAHQQFGAEPVIAVTVASPTQSPTRPRAPTGSCAARPSMAVPRCGRTFPADPRRPGGLSVRPSRRFGTGGRPHGGGGGRPLRAHQHQCGVARLACIRQRHLPARVTSAQTTGRTQQQNNTRRTPKSPDTQPLISSI